MLAGLPSTCDNPLIDWEKMKRTLITLFTCAVLGMPAMALEKRTFTSADGAKTFEGRLTDYDGKRGTVTVRKGMRNITFKLTVLSEKDIEYVKEHGNAVAAALYLYRVLRHRES